MGQAPQYPPQGPPPNAPASDEGFPYHRFRIGVGGGVGIAAVSEGSGYPFGFQAAIAVPLGARTYVRADLLVTYFTTSEDDAYDVNYTLPAKLAAAGVRFAITSGEDTPDTRDLPYVAGVAAAFGLSRDDALKAVTLWPAQIFGVGDKLGSLEVGKVANLVVTTGDLLEARTETKYLFIDGRLVPLDTKHSQLWEMFKDR